MIISVHIPKTAGRSFRSLLHSYFKENLKDDYRDSTINKSNINRSKSIDAFKKSYTFYKNYIFKLKGIQCIHGHFLPYKYDYHLNHDKDIFITWLRDPIERLVSHYFYRKMMYEKTVGTPQQKIMHNYSSFEEFCFSEKMINTYDKYFYKFPISNFDFIGIVEHFDEDFTYFAKHYLNLKINNIPKKNTNYKKTELNCLTDKAFIKKIKQVHSKDYEIYNQAMEMRKKRRL